MNTNLNYNNPVNSNNRTQFATDVTNWLNTNVPGIFTSVSLDISKVEINNIIINILSYNLLQLDELNFDNINNYLISNPSIKNNFNSYLNSYLVANPLRSTNLHMLTYNVRNYFICNNIPSNIWTDSNRVSINCNEYVPPAGAGAAAGFRSGPRENFRNYSFKGSYFESKYIPNEYHLF
jgi:hypothetical protein